MDAKELRIGNLFQFEQNDDDSISYHKVYTINQDSVEDVEIYSNGIQLSEDIVCTMMCAVKPIPLTEEWLVKFGFEKISQNEAYWFEFKKGSIEFISNDTYFNNGNDIWHIGVSIQKESAYFFNLNIKHVHQIQNLFYALTGEELIIKQ